MNPEGNRERYKYKEGSEFQESLSIFSSFYEENGGKLVNSCYSKGVALKKSFGIMLNPGEVEIPKMIFSTDVEDLKISSHPRYAQVHFDREYDEDGYPVSSYEALNGLENYYFFIKGGTPIYVFDNHSHALFAWQEARELGIIREGEGVLFHLDDHSDLRERQENFSPTSREQVKQALVSGIVDIADFIDPAFEANIFSEMYFCHSVPTLDLNHRDLEKGFGGEGKTIQRLRRAEKFFDITALSLQDPGLLIRKAEELKKQGKKIMLDIDFDLFSSGRADSLLSILPELARHCDVITCATSPSYIDQETAIKMVKNFISNI